MVTIWSQAKSKRDASWKLNPAAWHDTIMNLKEIKKDCNFLLFNACSKICRNIIKFWCNEAVNKYGNSRKTYRQELSWCWPFVGILLKTWFNKMPKHVSPFRGTQRGCLILSYVIEGTHCIHIEIRWLTFSCNKYKLNYVWFISTFCFLWQDLLKIKALTHFWKQKVTLLGHTKINCWAASWAALFYCMPMVVLYYFTFLF